MPITSDNVAATDTTSSSGAATSSGAPGTSTTAPTTNATTTGGGPGIAATAAESSVLTAIDDAIVAVDYNFGDTARVREGRDLLVKAREIFAQVGEMNRASAYTNG